jgi:hypothetical protein
LYAPTNTPPPTYAPSIATRTFRRWTSGYSLKGLAAGVAWQGPFARAGPAPGPAALAALPQQPPGRPLPRFAESVAAVAAAEPWRWR